MRPGAGAAVGREPLGVLVITHYNRLLAELIVRCERLGYRQVIAVIGDSANATSIALHARHGFLRVGTLRSTGYKFGRWVDSVLMQRPLGSGDGTPPAT